MHIDKFRKLRGNSYQSGMKLDISMNLITIFLKNVQKSPNIIAVMTSDALWTYQDLYNDVLLWVKRLNALNITDAPVMLCLHRTPRLLSILLALQWLELAYIPIDPQTPLERIAAIHKDSKSGLLLHDTSHNTRYARLSCVVWALIDLENAEPSTALALPANNFSPEAIAYVIYTSGTTGIPKGVSISRGALDNFLASMSHYFLKEDSEIVLATTTFTFDIAALELFLPIWQQKTLFLTNEEEQKDPLRIDYLLQTLPITLLQGTPSFWSMLNTSGWHAQSNLVAVCGGEPLTAQVVDKILPRVSSLWNMYGPTEATIWCSLKKIESKQIITVGKPIHNMQMCILDASKHPVPAGDKGELYIGGLGLSQGYLNQPALTDEVYQQVLGQRLYRTGDIASMTNEGEFMIHGRVDNQVKLHGYRIEIEDIEAHIKNCLEVRDCAVGVYKEQLIAYICVANKKAYSETILKVLLADKLPDFMLPKRFVYLEHLPLNHNGKLNRKALPAPTQTRQNESMQVTRMQASLLAIWCEILGLSRISIYDNFFALGGHSLLAVRIVVNVKQILKKNVNICDLYAAPSIFEFSERVSIAPDFIDISKENTPQKNMLWMPLTDFQFVLWISNLFTSNVKTLNVVGRRRIQGPLNQKALDLALQAMIQKHDALSYRLHWFLPIQKKQSKRTITWDECSLLEYDNDRIEFLLNQSIKKLQSNQKWPKNKPLLHAKLFKLTYQRVEIQLSMPHIISDQQSLEILFRDLSNAYLFYSNGLKGDIRLDRQSFYDYVCNKKDVSCAVSKKDETFWKNI